MANQHRGEISAVLGHRPFVLCLTLGALAELEDSFAVVDLGCLAKRFESGALSARDLLRIIGCGIRGGGTAMSDDEIAALPVQNGLQGYIDIATQLLSATFGAVGAEAPPRSNPPGPQNP